MAKTYDTYKDSGSVWVGDIPSEWNIGNFRYFGEFTKGKLPSTTNTEGKGLPIIGASEMLGKECRTFSEDANVPQCSNDDILILWDGANAGIISSHHKGIVSSTAVKYHYSNSDVNKNFLYYFLKSVEPNFKEKVNGTTIPHMNMKYINEIPLLMPPLSVQQSISSFLDTKCGEIDSLISIQEEMISELLAYKQSVITEAVTKGLDKKAKMKNSGVEWIGDIPEEWEVCKVKNIAIITNGSDPKTEGDIPVYGSGDGSFKTCGEYKEGPVVLLGRKGATLHIPHYIEGRYWNVDTAFDVKMKGNNSLKFFFYNAKCFDYKSYISATTLPSMTQTNYNNMKIPLPPHPVQQAIATYLDEKTSQIDSLIALKQSKIESLKEYKKSIIYEYVTGKKRV